MPVQADRVAVAEEPLLNGSPEPAPVSSKVQRMTIAILGLLAICSYLDRGIISILIEPMRADLGVTDFQISLVQGAAFVLFHSLCSLPLGWMVDRYSRRWIIFGGAAIWVAAASATGLARNFWQLFLARLGVGGGEAALSPAAYSMMSDIIPRERLAFAASIYSLGPVIGASSAVLLGGILLSMLTASGPIVVPLLGTLQPWQQVFLITGLSGIPLAFLIFLIPEPVRRSHLSADQVTMRQLFSRICQHRVYVSTHLLGFGMIGILGGAATAWYPTFLIRNFQLSPDRVGILAGAALAIAGVLGCPVAGAVTDLLYRAGQKAGHIIYAIGAAFMMTAAGLVSFSTDSVALSVTCFGILFFFAIVSPLALAHFQLTFDRREIGRMTAIYLLVYTVMSIAGGATMVAWFTDFIFGDPQKLGLSLLMTYAIAGPLAMLLLLLCLRPAVRAVAAMESH